jgi:putative transcriptional regulator
MKSYSKHEPKAGNLLLSEPFLKDENFVRSVILLCENDINGTFGLVLNKLSILNLSDLIEECSNLDCEVYVGGPVEQNTLHFIYFGNKEGENSVALGPNLWWGGDFDQIITKLKNNLLDIKNFRFFIGYSGWDVGQLDTEIEENTWIVCPNDNPEHIFNYSPDQFWRKILKNMGGEYQVLANYPLDPRLN